MARILTLFVGLLIGSTLFADEAKRLTVDEAATRLNALFSRENAENPALPIPVVVSPEKNPHHMKMTFGNFSKQPDGSLRLMVLRSEYQWKYNDQKEMELDLDADGKATRRYTLFPIAIRKEANSDYATMTTRDGLPNATEFDIYAEGEKGVVWKFKTAVPFEPNASASVGVMIEIGVIRVNLDANGKTTYDFDIKNYSVSEALANKLVLNDGKPNEEGKRTFKGIPLSEVPALIESKDLVFQKDSNSGFKQVQP